MEDQGSSQAEDIARVRSPRKQGPTQERSTTAPIAPVSNTEGMEEVKKTLRDIQDALNKPIATRACDPRTGELEKRLQVLEKNLEEIRKTIKPHELPRAVGGNREATNKNEGRRTWSLTPEDIQCFRCQGKVLTDQEREDLRQLLIEYADVFAAHDLDLGCFNATPHRIHLEDKTPIKQRMRRVPRGFEGEEEKNLRAMLDAGVIQPSASPWASPPVLVRKKDGGVRWWLDFRRLNAVTKKHAFSLPLISDCIESLAGNWYMSTLDMASGYWQIEIHPDDREYTAFITRFGLFEHKHMSMGLCNVPSTFQRAMDLVLRGLTWKTVLAFLDDVLVLGQDFEDHLKNLREVFRTIPRL